MVYDDVRGHPQGHFVVLSEYDTETRAVVVADPLGAILLGILTYDANFLVIEPPSGLGR